MRIFTLALLFLTAAGLTTGCVKQSDEGDSLLTEGDNIPSFTVSGPEGTVSSTDFTGKGGLIVLFASYCPSCKTTLPGIEKIWEASEEGKLFVVAPLSRQAGNENEALVAELWEDEGYTMPYYLDTKGNVYYQFAKQSIPRLYVVDKQGKITFMSVGNVSTSVLASELGKATGVDVNI